MGGVGWTEKNKQANAQTKGTTSSPALSGGVGRTKETAGTKLPSPIRQETAQTLTLKFRKHQKQPKEKNPHLKMQKIPETTQGKKIRKRKTVERGGGVKVNQPRPRL